MSTISASTTSTTAFKVTSDTTGTLVFQTGASPTTAMTLGSDQSVTFAGAQTYTGAATFTTGISVQGLTVGRGAGAVSTNTAVGASALAANTSGSENTAVGYQAAYSNQTGANIVAIGRYAAYSSTAGNLAAVGVNALYANTSGVYNTAVGSTEASGGLGVMRYNTTGSYNTALGGGALAQNTTASNNTAVGYQAGYSNQTGASNTIVGQGAGASIVSTNANTILGASAFSGTGGGNICIGYGAGNAMTSGTNNSIYGSFSGNAGGLNITTANNYIVIANGAANGDWKAYTAGTGWYQSNNSASWNTTSDARIKENITDIQNGLTVITALRPVEFDYILSKQHTEGFIAQEYELVLPNQIMEEAAVSDELKELTGGEPVKAIQQNLVPYLVAAIKELKAEFDAYKEAHP